MKCPTPKEGAGACLLGPSSLMVSSRPLNGYMADRAQLSRPYATKMNLESCVPEHRGWSEWPNVHVFEI